MLKKNIVLLSNDQIKLISFDEQDEKEFNNKYINTNINNNLAKKIKGQSK